MAADPVTVNGSTVICKKDKAHLSSSGGIAYSWSPEATLDTPSSAETVATPLQTTEYSVTITTDRTVAGKNCNYLLTTKVTVDVLSASGIKATANPNYITIGDKSTLSYIGDPGAMVLWYTGTSPTTGYSVTASPSKPTTYTVVASKGACTETTTVHIDAFNAGCLGPDVFIPNTFTPNRDGYNDILYVRSAKVSELYFAVYNRWGELVFETNDINNGWDGRYKGKDADPGVFGWYLKGKCINGEESCM
jgi:gliding motility-associated-like protein